MMELLNDPLIWLVFSFAIFAVILWRMGKQAFVNKLDEHIETIRDEIETAENLRVEAQELLAQYQRKHRDAVDEAKSIIDEARRHAAEIMKHAEEELAEITERRERQLQDRLERLEQTAIGEIQKHAADLAIKATTEIIADKLDKKANEKLVENSINQLSSNIH